MFHPEKTQTTSISNDLEKQFQSSLSLFRDELKTGFADKEKSTATLEALIDISKQYVKAHQEQETIPPGLPNKYWSVSLKYALLFLGNILIALKKPTDPVSRAKYAEDISDECSYSLQQLSLCLSSTEQGEREIIFANVVNERCSAAIEAEIAMREQDCEHFKSKETIIVEQVEKYLGERFVNMIRSSSRASWGIECKGEVLYSLQLKELLITSANDCTWYKNRLKKAGIEEADINFIPTPRAHDQGMGYKLEILNISKIYFKWESEQETLQSQLMSEAKSALAAKGISLPGRKI